MLTLLQQDKYVDTTAEDKYVDTATERQIYLHYYRKTNMLTLLQEDKYIDTTTGRQIC